MKLIDSFQNKLRNLACRKLNLVAKERLEQELTELRKVKSEYIHKSLGVIDEQQDEIEQLKQRVRKLSEHLRDAHTVCVLLHSDLRGGGFSGPSVDLRDALDKWALAWYDARGKAEDKENG